MEKYLAALMFCVSSAYAQSDIATVQIHCVSREEVDAMLNQYEELPFVRGLSLREQNGIPMSNSVVLFVNAKTGTWTVVERTPDKKYCVISAGTKFEPVPMEIIEDLQKERSSGKS